MSENQSAFAPLHETNTRLTSLWILYSNVCDRGKFKVDIEMNSGEKVVNVFYGYPHQSDGIVSGSQNLTPLLQKSYDQGVMDAISALRSEFETTDKSAATHFVDWLENRFMVKP